MTADLTVAIATFDDDPDVLAQVLDAVLAEGLEQAPLVVDMSRGQAPGRVAEGRAVRYVAFPESQGLSDSRNRAVALAGTRYVLFVDADAVPERGWAEAMRRGFDRDERAAVVGARCLPLWPKRPPALFDTKPALDLLGMFDLGLEPREVPRIMGTSFALDRERLAGDPPFALELGRRPGELLGGEEVELCRAVRAAGWTVRYEPGAVVRHHVRPERVNWLWMLRRAVVAGREWRRAGERLEPLPRSLGARDALFLAAIAPPYLAGRLRH